jgi:hypothetical protein
VVTSSRRRCIVGDEFIHAAAVVSIMPIKGDGEANLRVAGRFDRGFSWIAYPDELMQRASHAIAVDGDVWLVDPVDAPGLDAELEDLGQVAGVVLLLDRHKRDCGTVATRHDVPVSVPASMSGVVDEIDADIERFESELADTGLESTDLINNRFWQEVALYDHETATLVVPESVGTSSYFRTEAERLGVHPMLRLRPPRRTLQQFSPDRVLVGHGDPVLTEASVALTDALAYGRRRTPRLYASMIKSRLTG